MEHYTDSLIHPYAESATEPLKVVNFENLLNKLRANQNKVLKVAALLDFMSTLEGENKTDGKNGIARLQYFLNAYAEEMALLRANIGILEPINDDHDGIVRGGHGENAADFWFNCSNGRRYKIEVKMFWDKDSYFSKLPKTNFHEAHFAIVYLITERRWYIAKSIDSYTTLTTLDEIIIEFPYLAEINFPTSFTTISFEKGLASKTDAEVYALGEVSYSFRPQFNIK